MICPKCAGPMGPGKHGAEYCKPCWLEKKIGADRGNLGQYRDVDTRNALRSWVGAKSDLPFSVVKAASYDEMRKAYNDMTGTALLALARELRQGKPQETQDKAPEPPQDTKEAPRTSDPEPEAEKPQAKPQEAEKALPASDDNSAEGLLRQALEMIARRGGVNETEVRRIAAEEAAKVKAPERIVVIETGADGTEKSRKDIGLQHYLFPLLLKLATTRLPPDGVPCNVALVGPAGSGKTTAFRALAKALNRPWELTPACIMPSAVLGYRDATGKYHDTPMYRAFANGGVHLADEADSWSPAASLAANAMSANGHASFPCGMTDRHKDCVLGWAMNTYGTGQDRIYVGRTQQDGSVLDRLFFLSWPVDNALTASVIGLNRPQQKIDLGQGGIVDSETWYNRVSTIATAVEKLKVRHIVSPRATIIGAALAASGIGRYWLEEGLLWKGLDSEQRARVEQEAR